MKKRIAILGSTGSIGRQTLDVVARFPDRLEVVALTAQRDAKALLAQAEQFRPQWLALTDPARRDEAPPRCRVGAEALVEIATLPEVDLVVVAVVGTAGLPPTLAALRAGKDVALSTKEALVV